MTPPQLTVVLELEREPRAWLSSFSFADEIRLAEYLDAHGVERLESEVLSALRIGLEVLRARAAEAVPADVYRRRAA